MLHQTLEIAKNPIIHTCLKGLVIPFVLHKSSCSIKLRFHIKYSRTRVCSGFCDRTLDVTSTRNRAGAPEAYPIEMKNVLQTDKHTDTQTGPFKYRVPPELKSRKYARKSAFVKK